MKSATLSSLPVLIVIASGCSFDVTVDGQRFLMVKPGGTLTDDTTASPELILVLNWFDELQRLVPTTQ